MMSPQISRPPPPRRGPPSPPSRPARVPHPAAPARQPCQAPAQKTLTGHTTENPPPTPSPQPSHIARKTRLNSNLRKSDSAAQQHGSPVPPSSLRGLVCGQGPANTASPPRRPRVHSRRIVIVREEHLLPTMAPFRHLIPNPRQPKPGKTRKTRDVNRVFRRPSGENMVSPPHVSRGSRQRGPASVRRPKARNAGG